MQGAPEKPKYFFPNVPGVVISKKVHMSLCSNTTTNRYICLISYIYIKNQFFLMFHGAKCIKAPVVENT